MSLLADYYDGKSTRRHAVIFQLEGDRLRISGEGIERAALLHELRISEPLGGAPRLVTFPDGAFCEIHDQAGLQALLQQTGFQDHFVVRWQYSLRWIAISVVLCLAVFFACYRWGLPWVSEKIAAEMPDIVLQSVSDQVLASLDRHFLAPSKLPSAHQEALSARFAALTPPAGNPVVHRVIFRANRTMQANAIALPSGTIILTDDLVALSTKDNELMAVLAHELGHIHDRHGMRLVLQGSIVGIITAWFVGDISSVIAAAPAALLQASYSREFERDADAFAARMLGGNAISPQCLADILFRMEKTHPEAAPGGSDAKFDAYLNSHPATAERLDVLRGRACE
ncbi:MAG: M48 family metallopeptidase [Betaproteobacteria bacterium]